MPEGLISLTEMKTKYSSKIISIEMYQNKTKPRILTLF
jgi:hypothetical protein